MKARGILTRLMCAVLLFAAVTGTVEATDYYVTTNGSPEHNGLAWTDAWETITYALNFTNVPSGSVINVGTGEFAECLLITNAITLTGADIYYAGNAPLFRHESKTIIRPPTNDSYSALITVATNGVTIQNLTIDCGPYDSIVPDVTNGIYSGHRPLVVSNCAIVNVNGYGIHYVVSSSTPSTNDTDSVRGYFGYNMITNITHEEPKATGIYMKHAPATCEYNEFAGIYNQIAAVDDTNEYAGIYVHKCYYTSNMTDWVTINSNYFDGCTLAIWANQFGTKGEKINIRGNIITNGVVGIRVTQAMGQALITSNSIAVSGISPSSNTPARGIWIQADYNPWDTNYMAATDHMVEDNVVIGASTNADGTIGMLFEYDAATWTNINNGVRATVSNNAVYGFDYGVFIESGTNGVGKTNDPLIEIIVHFNVIYGNISYGLLATGMTNIVNATSNWWGYGSFANTASGYVNYDYWSLGLTNMDSDMDGTNDYMDTDDDNDGFIDWYEVIAGTDMTNSLSLFMFSSAEWLLGTGFEIKWTSVSGRYYNVYRTTNLLTGFGASLTNFIADSPENSFTDTTAIGPGPYFYRVTVTN